MRANQTLHPFSLQKDFEYPHAPVPCGPTQLLNETLTRRKLAVQHCAADRNGCHRTRTNASVQ